VNSKVINVVAATKIGKYQLHLLFDDQSSQDVDFGPFLNQSQHPYIRGYLDEARVSAFRLEYGELVWGDFDLCSRLIVDSTCLLIRMDRDSARQEEVLVFPLLQCSRVR
jgi:hypothetical protein